MAAAVAGDVLLTAASAVTIALVDVRDVTAVGAVCGRLGADSMEVVVRFRVIMATVGAFALVPPLSDCARVVRRVPFDHRSGESRCFLLRRWVRWVRGFDPAVCRVRLFARVAARRRSRLRIGRPCFPDCRWRPLGSAVSILRGEVGCLKPPESVTAGTTTDA